MKHLNISPDLVLPLDFVTQTAAILARKRVGKTYTASVIAEEMVKVELPFVVLDPTGAWWGLRASADGKSEGLPVVIIGGAHGDVPLEATAGKVIADLVVDHPGKAAERARIIRAMERGAPFRRTSDFASVDESTSAFDDVGNAA